MKWLWGLILLGACHKEKAPDPAVAAAQQVVADAVKEQAFRDLQNDVALLRAQLAVMPMTATRVGTALYTCDRLALAQRELAEEARAQSLLGEADSLCAYQAPLAAAGVRLAALESAQSTQRKSAPPECGPIRDALVRVSAKYKNDAQLAALMTRFKTGCPKVRLFAAPPRVERSAPSGPDPRAQRDACKKRCDDAAFSCRGSCSYCFGCTTDKTQEWCTTTCNNCRQGCEQNEKFCRASCGD